jgi:hypothetical protein
MRRRVHTVSFLSIGFLALAEAGARESRYPTPAQLKQVRSAVLYLSVDGALAQLDPVEWCEEVEQFLRERGLRRLSRRHQQVLNEVAVELPGDSYRKKAQEIVRLVTSAPPPLSRFRARFEVRHFDNTLLVARYEGEQWREAWESRSDPVPFTLTLAPGQWMMSMEHTEDGRIRLALWDKVGEANPYEVQAVVALPDGSLHRSRVIPWNPEGVEVFLPSDFPTLAGRALPKGAYHAIFEADGQTIDWQRSLSFLR